MVRTPPPRRAVGWILLVVAAGAFFVAVAAAHPIRRFDQFRNPTLSAGDLQAHILSSSGNGRWQFWASAIKEFESKPGFGRGAGSYEAWWLQHGSLPLFVQDAHSLYVEVLGELGIVGFLLLVGIFAAGLFTAVRRLIRMPAVERVTPAAVTATFVAFAIGAAVDWMWELTIVPVVALACLALAIGPGTALSVRPRIVPPGAGPPLRTRLQRYGLGAGIVIASWLLICAMAIPMLAGARLQDSKKAVARGDLRTAYSAALDARAIQPWSAEPELQLALVQERALNYSAARRWIVRATRATASIGGCGSPGRGSSTSWGGSKPAPGASNGPRSSTPARRSSRREAGGDALSRGYAALVARALGVQTTWNEPSPKNARHQLCPASLRGACRTARQSTGPISRTSSSGRRAAGSRSTSRELWRYRELLYFLVWRDVKVRYKQTVARRRLGGPPAAVLTMVVFTPSSAGSRSSSRRQSLPALRVRGAAAVDALRERAELSRAAASSPTRSLITKVYFPRLVSPARRVLAGLVDFAHRVRRPGRDDGLLRSRPELAAARRCRRSSLLAVVHGARRRALAVGAERAVPRRRIRDPVPDVQFWLFATPVAYPSSLSRSSWRTLVRRSTRWRRRRGLPLGAPRDDGARRARSMFVSAAVRGRCCSSAALFYFRRMERTFADVV